MGKTVLKKVWIDEDYSEGIGWYSRLWDIPESELMRRALTALATGGIPTERLLTQADRERMHRNLLKRWEEGQTFAPSSNGEPISDREALHRRDMR